MEGNEQVARISVHPFLGCYLNVHVWVGVNPRQERRVRGMCAFELTIDALNKAVDDTIRHMDRSTQHISRILDSTFHRDHMGIETALDTRIS